MKTETKTKIKNRFRFVTVIIAVVVVSFFVSFITYNVVSKRQENEKREAYYRISDSNDNALFEISDNRALMFDEKAYNKFESTCLGNKNSWLLSFGKYFENDTLVCISKDKTVLTINEKEFVVNDFPSSYINVIDDYVYYRDDSTRQVYRYSILNHKSECIIQERCGQVIVSKKGISYIDATSKLNHIQFDTFNKKQVLKDKIKSFAVIGNSYYCLKSDNKFGIVTSNGIFNKIATDVERFFCDGKILIQKGSNIYVIGKNNKTEYELVDVEGIVIGFSNNKIYTNENQVIKAYNTTSSTSKNTIVELDNDEILKSFYVSDETFEIITYTSTDSLYTEQHKTIKR